MEYLKPSDIVTEVLAQYNEYVPFVRSRTISKEIVTGVAENNSNKLYTVDNIYFDFIYKKNVKLIFPMSVGNKIFENKGVFLYKDVYYSNRTIAHFVTYLSCYLFCKENPDIFALLYKITYKGESLYGFVNVNYTVVGESIYEEWKKIKKEK